MRIDRKTSGNNWYMNFTFGAEDVMTPNVRARMNYRLKWMNFVIIGNYDKSHRDIFI